MKYKLTRQDGSVTLHLYLPLPLPLGSRIEVIESVPLSVPLWKLRSLVEDEGIISQVQAAVDASYDTAIKAAWEYAPEIFRHSPSIVALGKAIGMTEKQLDDLFIAADKVTA